MAWCASAAYNLPRDPTAVSLMTESTDHLSALAATALACASKRTSPTPAFLARVGQAAEAFAKAPRDLPDVIKGTVLELGCLGTF